jgi:hypothetical protein
VNLFDGVVTDEFFSRPGLKTWTFSGAVWNRGQPERMVLLEIHKQLDWRAAARYVPEIEEAIRREMRVIFKEKMALAEGGWGLTYSDLDMPDVGLKVVYTEEKAYSEE